MTERFKKNDTLIIQNAGHISLLSHDIRSCFSELQTSLSSLNLTPDLPPSIKKDLAHIAHTNAYMGRLLDEVSEVVFQDHQIRQPRPLVCDLRESLRNSLRRWKKITARLGCCLQITGDELVPEQANLDILALERVLSNLVSNALHHAGPGPISIDISRSGTGNQEELIFRVRDAGHGFPRPVIEDSGMKDVPIGAGEPGSGYGLRVAREAARRLGGRLLLQNPPDGGAEASLILPVQPLLFPHDQVEGNLPLFPHGLTALIVEDSTAMRAELRHILKGLGLAVIEAWDGAMALEILKNSATQIDIIYLDIELPLFSGMQVLGALRDQIPNPPPVIAITAHVFAANRHKILDAGAQDVLTKPLQSRADVLHTTARALQHKLPKSWLDCARARTEAIAQSASAHSLQIVLKRLPPEAGRTVLRHLGNDLDTLLGDMARLSEGALTRQDRDKLRLLSHSLSGLFATANDVDAQHRARQLSEAAPRIESPEIIETLTVLRQSAATIQKQFIL